MNIVNKDTEFKYKTNYSLDDLESMLKALYLKLINSKCRKDAKDKQFKSYQHLSIQARNIANTEDQKQINNLCNSVMNELKETSNLISWKRIISTFNGLYQLYYDLNWIEDIIDNGDNALLIRVNTQCEFENRTSIRTIIQNIESYRYNSHMNVLSKQKMVDDINSKLGVKYNIELATVLISLLAMDLDENIKREKFGEAVDKVEGILRENKLIYESQFIRNIYYFSDLVKYTDIHLLSILKYTGYEQTGYDYLRSQLNNYDFSEKQLLKMRLLNVDTYNGMSMIQASAILILKEYLDLIK